MKWNKFRLKTTTESEDIVSSMLMDLGIQGIEIEDKIPLTQSDKEQMFVDILPEIEADDGVAYISFYLEEDEDKEEVLANVKKELEELMKLSNEYFDVRHNDYLNAAKEKREALNDSLFIEYLYNRAYAMLYLLRLKHKETNECE